MDCLPVNEPMTYVQVTCDLVAEEGPSVSPQDTSFRMLRMSSVQFKIVTAAMLDREEEQEHALAVVCVDRGDVRRTSVTQLLVRVTDVNDNEPEFTSDIYRATLVSDNNINEVGGKDCLLLLNERRNE